MKYRICPFAANGLAGKDGAEVDLFISQADAATIGDHHDFVMEGIVDIWQSLVDPGGRLIDLSRALHVQSFVRALVVEPQMY